MLRDHVAVFELGGQSCNLSEKTSVWAEKNALALLRHLLSQ